MRILVVARYKERGFAPFVTQQVVALEKQGVECQFFPVKSKGVAGYLKHLKALNNAIRDFHPDVVHAHYGLCGLLANLQRRVPVVTTFHGSDINDKKVLPLSKMAMRLSAWNIFVSKKTIDIAKPKKKYSLLPCGIDLSDLQLTGKQEAQKRMHLQADKKYVLFAGAFDNAVKNASLAKESVALLNDENVELLELKGFSHDEVTLMMCAVDVFLMTSISEGSPQVIKEALACGCPIVSVDVGDVKERIAGVESCTVADRNAEKLALALKKAISFGKRTEGRVVIIHDNLTNEAVASQLKDIYNQVSKN
ncbi:MAG: glycosyltransferase [Bacteroidales bacterium]|nr:glycosyltransferase [Bacteroidales bacterium]